MAASSITSFVTLANVIRRAVEFDCDPFRA
jgi:hypothetical protein